MKYFAHILLIAGCVVLGQSFVVVNMQKDLPKENLHLTEYEGLGAYNAWKSYHGKVYNSLSEELSRYTNFLNNKKTIDAHNEKTLGWKMALNQFSDMTPKEFRSLRLMKSQNCSATVKGSHVLSGKQIPFHMSWQELGRVGPVKDQGNCGSCWTFSTTGCLESATAIHKEGNPLYTLSEQQLVDCAQAFDNNGCDGGLPSHAFEYIHYSNGLMNEWDYKYHATDGNCTFNPNRSNAFVDKVHNVTAGNEIELADAVAFMNPVSVAFDCMEDFMHYSEGIYSNPTCGSKPSEVNHAVLAVGFGENKEGKQYWIVKNSWGTQWGIDGYFFIERGSNMCGIADCASYPSVPKR